MGRLTYEKPDGQWGLKGHDIKKVPGELYGMICKLHEYEKSGLEPDEVEKVGSLIRCFVELYFVRCQKKEPAPDQLLDLDEVYKIYEGKYRESADLAQKHMRLIDVLIDSHREVFSGIIGG